MNHLSIILAFFSAPAEAQITALPFVPSDVGRPDFQPALESSSLLVLAQAFKEYFFQKDNESEAAFAERMGLSRTEFPWPQSIHELFYLLGTMSPANGALWCQKGLQRRVEWRLVRRVSKAVLADFGWAQPCDGSDISELVAHYLPKLRSNYREYGQPWKV